MEQKTYIGLTPTKEIQEAISKLKKETYNLTDNFLVNHYIDDNGLSQLREDCWLIAEQDGVEILKVLFFVRAIKDDLAEGEQVTFKWT